MSKIVNSVDMLYKELALDILNYGAVKEDRTGTGTKSLFGRQIRIPLSEGFPLLTTKKVFFRGIKEELLWFIRGERNVRPLVQKNVSIWTDWAYEKYVKACNSGNIIDIATEVSHHHHTQVSHWFSVEDIEYDGDIQPTPIAVSQLEFEQLIRDDEHFANTFGDLGAIYGVQWRNFNEQGVDQLSNAIDMLKNSPDSRRIIVSAWNPAQVHKQALPPCHAFFQFYTREITPQEAVNYLGKHPDFEKTTPENGGVGKNIYNARIEKAQELGIHIPRRVLDMQMYQRSADLFLGVPFNIASYALLQHMVAKEVDMLAGHFIHTFGDVHIYSNHMTQIHEQLHNEPYSLCELHLKDGVGFFDYDSDDIWIENYQSHSRIKAPVAV